MYDGHLRTAPTYGCDNQSYTNIAGDYVDYYMPVEVINELQSNPNYPNTVGGLLALANDALGGVGGYNNGMLTKISDAASIINEAFDECRFGYFVDPDGSYVPPMEITSPTNPYNNKVSTFLENTTLKASPNPFSSVANIEFSIPMTVRVELQVYTLQGQHVETLYTGMAEEDVIHTYQFHAEGIHNQATYVYILRTIYGTKMGKMIMIK
jgi:hypothetical protein